MLRRAEFPAMAAPRFGAGAAIVVSVIHQPNDRTYAVEVHVERPAGIGRVNVPGTGGALTLGLGHFSVERFRSYQDQIAQHLKKASPRLLAGDWGPGLLMLAIGQPTPPTRAPGWADAYPDIPREDIP